CRVYPGAKKELRILGDGDSDQENCYEVYIPSSKFRGVQIAEEDSDKHFTENAYFELSMNLQNGLAFGSELPSPDPEPESTQHLPDIGPRLSVFGDRTLPAYDIGITNGNDYDELRSALSYSDSVDTPVVYSQPAGWSRREGYVEKVDGEDYQWTFDHWVDDDPWPHNVAAPGEDKSGMLTRVLDDGDGSTLTIETLVPYWNGVPDNSGIYHANPSVQRCNYHWKSPHFRYLPGTKRECFGATAFWHGRFNQEELHGATVMQQEDPWGYTYYKGTYLARNIGLHVGGNVILSYGPKDPPCFEDSDKMDVPGPVGVKKPSIGVRERAMDLTNERGRVTITLMNGGYEYYASTHADSTNIKEWNQAWTVANAILSAYPGTQPIALISVSAQAVTNVALPDPGVDGSARVELFGYKQKLDRPDRRDDDTSEKSDRKGESIAHWNGSSADQVPQSGSNDFEKRETISVGQQLSVGVEVLTQAHLRADAGQSYAVAWAKWIPQKGEEQTVRLKIIDKKEAP
ncbi:MAG: hypothetical protein ACOC0A_04650, partial [Planctomycetota bacterium]